MDKYVYVKSLQDVIDSNISLKNYTTILLRILIIGNIYNIVLVSGKYVIYDADRLIYDDDIHVVSFWDIFFECFIPLAEWRQNRLEEVLNG